MLYTKNNTDFAAQDSVTEIQNSWKQLDDGWNDI